MVPTKDGRQLSPQELTELMQQLTPEQQAHLEETHHALTAELAELVQQIHQMELEARRRMKEIDREVAVAAVQHHFDDMKTAYKQDEEMLLYLGEVHQEG
jgi:vacuolar-type H+-ATPase subunit D/Vma8